MEYLSDGMHVPPEFDVCELDLSKIDRAWKSVDQLYLPPGGTLGGGFPQSVVSHHRKRYNSASQKVASGTIVMPVISLDEDGDLRIVDGRHRIAACRDAALGRIKVMAPAQQAHEISIKLG